MSFNSHKLFSTKLKLCVTAFLLISPMVGLTACSHKDTMEYAPLTYDYLTPIFFNIEQIKIQDQSASNQYPRDISNLSPTPPALALNNMINNRFKPRGNSGIAVFTINRASLQESSDNAVYGQIDLTLSIYNKNNKKVGSIQVSTNHTYQTDHHKGNLDSRANLYDITQKMMQEVNVELEYQIRNHLEPWIVDATGTPISDSIKSQDLNNSPAPQLLTPTASSSKPVTKKSNPSNEDLSAVFPDGVPTNNPNTQNQNTQSVSSNKSKRPVGVLGTLPQSTTFKKY